MIETERAEAIPDLAPPWPAARATGGRQQRVGRRRPLPGSRAVVGALLVATSLVVTFAAYTEATTTRTGTYVVARHALRLGQTLTASDVATVDLAPPPPQLARRMFRDPGVLVGAIVLGPVGGGELLQASDVLTGGSRGSPFEISVPVEQARSVGGDLVPGDVVDVAATFGTGADAYTLYVVRHARVVALDEPSRALGGSGEQVITLAVRSDQEALAVAHALSAGDVSIVRASGTAEPNGPAVPYRAPAARESTEGSRA